MRRFLLAAAAAGALAVEGCGDDSKACGMATMDVDGYCLPTNSCGPGTKLDPTANECVPDGSVVCTGATMFDATTGTCVLDPTACQDGTVDINGACVDPTRGLTVDLDEGNTEPNGLGIIEQSTTGAGSLDVPAIGTPFIIHGRIAPFQDADGDGQLDPDVDTYVITATGPAVLEISVDGVAGIAGAFAAEAVVDAGQPLATWRRYSWSVTGDTSTRQIYLPAAGTYLLAIADTRTLQGYATGGSYAAAPGPGEYYVSISQVAIPSATALTVVNGTVSEDGTTLGDVQLFTFQVGTDSNDVTLVMPNVQVQGSLLVSDGAFYAQAPAVGDTAELVLDNFTSADTATVVLDAVYNYATSPVPYTLTIVTSDGP